MKVACQNPGCSNYGQVIDKWPNKLYAKIGKMPDGRQRYKCRGCLATFTVDDYITHGNRKNPDIILLIARSLLSGKTVRDICAIAHVGPPNFYEYIGEISKLLSHYERISLLEIPSSAHFVFELCDNIPVELEYDVNSFYLRSVKMLNRSGLHRTLAASAPAISIEKYLLKKLSIFNGHRRMLRSKSPDDILNIFRICYNFSGFSHGANTPAMKLGVASAPVKLQQLLALSL